jgi:hypothetical protein
MSKPKQKQSVVIHSKRLRRARSRIACSFHAPAILDSAGFNLGVERSFMLSRLSIECRNPQSQTATFGWLSSIHELSKAQDRLLNPVKRQTGQGETVVRAITSSMTGFLR